MAYVERNPVRARIVERAESFRWSSAAGRLGGDRDREWVDFSRWRAEYTRDQWRQVLETSVEEDAFGRRLQEASRRGRPLGQESFAHGLEQLAGRPLLPRAVGRPGKPSPEGDQLSLQIGI
jgi:putative transposase